MIERVSTSIRGRRALSAVAVAAVLALTAGCTSTTARTTGTDDGAGVVGISLPQSDDANWARAGDALRAELTDRGYRVDLQYAAADARTQGSQVQNMLTKGADAIVVAPLSIDELDAPLTTAAEDTIPVVAFERALQIPGLGFVAASDPEAIGRAQAQAVLTDLTARDAAGTPRVAVLAGDGEDPWTVRRYDAAMQTLAPAAAEGSIDIVVGASLDDAATTGDDDAAAAEERTRSLLVPETDADGDTAPAPTAVLALTDTATRGVVAALTTPPPDDASPIPSASPTPRASPTSGASATSTASPTTGTTAPQGPDLDEEIAVAPLVIGSGADVGTVRALRDGVIDATVFVDSRALVSWAADAVQALLDEVAPRVDGSTPAGLDGVPAATASASIVRARDIDRLLLDTGWLTADELDG